MKYVFGFLVFCSLFNLSLSAQSGSVLYYGNLNLQKYSGAADVYDITMVHGLGYQFNNRMSAGAEVTFSGYKIANQKTKVFRLGPFYRYSIPLSNMFSIYGQIGAGWVKRKASINDTGYYINLFPAIYMKVYKGLGINFSMGEFNYSVLGGLKEIRVKYGDIPTLGLSLNIGGAITKE